SLAFTPDARRLVGINVLLRMWDVKTGKPVGPDFGPLAVQVPSAEPRSHFVVTANQDGQQIYLWDVRTGQVCFTTPYSGSPRVVWLSPDAKHLHVCGAFRLLSWDLATRTLIREVD